MLDASHDAGQKKGIQMKRLALLITSPATGVSSTLMKQRCISCLVATSLAIFGLTSQPALAATGTITAQIVAVGHTVALPSQPNGYVYIRLSQRFTLAGACAYSGTVDAPANWNLRIDSSDASYRGLLAVALSAYATGKTVRVDYDDIFGVGSECRVTYILEQD
jgi:hypothetical protein